MDRETVRKAVESIIQAIGEDLNREGLVGTPARIAEMYAEVFSGINSDPREHLRVGFQEDHHEMVIFKDIPFYSMCEHHLLPFHGLVHVGYIPNGWVVGASKMSRVVDVLAKRPQLQERLTSQIADTIVEVLQPKGAAVVVEAEHLCMTMRGVKKPGSTVVTSAMRGLFRRTPATRSEFLSLVKSK